MVFATATIYNRAQASLMSVSPVILDHWISFPCQARQLVNFLVSSHSASHSGMLCRSCTSLFDLAAGDTFDIPHTPRALARILSEDEGWPASSIESREKKIIVTNFLPINARKDSDSGKWFFAFDEDSIFLQMKDGFASDTLVVYVGSLKLDIEPIDQEEVSQRLLEEFKCVPTFLPPEVHKHYYQEFCKQHLWPIFHYMLPITPDSGTRFDRRLWQAYVSANKIFSKKVMEIINPDTDFVMVQDYHLMLLPTFLRKQFGRVKLGFFLHSPFPSSEIYRTLPVREEILKGLLNADLIGFQTFDYARHFLSCCGRMLGLEYESKRGHIGLEYFGRTVYIKILPVGVHVGRLEGTLNHPSSWDNAKELRKRHEGKAIILGVDDMDVFKGISLKLLAVEQLLNQNPCWRGKIVVVQIVNPARSSGNDVKEAQREMYLVTRRINARFGFPGYDPVVLIDRFVHSHEKTAYYTLADCCIVNAVRDGMNLVPYKYIVCRNGSPDMDEALELVPGSGHTSTLVVSEFIGCSPSLSGAIRVNPWDIESVADALNSALTMPESEKRLRHEKHYKYVSSHDVAYWARSFLQDLERACMDHYRKRYWGIGFGLNFRILALSPSFRKLSIDHIASVYKQTSRRVIFLDYDGTIVPESSISMSPADHVISALNNLCCDPMNTVFLVSGRGRDSLSNWFSQCDKLGLAAEHGYFLRWDRNSDWETSLSDTGLDWKSIAEPVMRLYTETTDGSYIEIKESALVWQYRDADPDFGSCQSKELVDHLESVLAKEPVVVKKGHHIVEVKPQGVTKGQVVEEVLSKLTNEDKAPDFVLCIGDDKSDEDMFESIRDRQYYSKSRTEPKIFACTVGQKPSKARYYLDDTVDVLSLLSRLDNGSAKFRKHIPETVTPD